MDTHGEPLARQLLIGDPSLPAPQGSPVSAAVLSGFCLTWGSFVPFLATPLCLGPRRSSGTRRGLAHPERWSDGSEPHSILVFSIWISVLPTFLGGSLSGLRAGGPFPTEPDSGHCVL